MLSGVVLCLCIGICAINDILKRTVDIRILLVYFMFLTVCSCVQKNFSIENFLTGILAGVIVAVISFVSNGAIGMGDAFIYALILCFMGFQKGIFVVFLSVVFAFFAAIFLVVAKGKSKNYEMPLVPFVFAAYLYLLFAKVV